MCLEFLKRVVAKAIYTNLPGVYNILESICRSRYGTGAVDLFFKSPSKVYIILSEMYDEYTASKVINKFFILPVLEELGKVELAKKVTDFTSPLDIDNLVRDLLREVEEHKEQPHYLHQLSIT